jgi:hypothetical protein
LRKTDTTQTAYGNQKVPVNSSHNPLPSYPFTWVLILQFPVSIRQKLPEVYKNLFPDLHCLERLSYIRKRMCVLFQDIQPPEEPILDDSKDLPDLTNRIQSVGSKVLQFELQDVTADTERY